jgi:hypothetical protein
MMILKATSFFNVLIELLGFYKWPIKITCLNSFKLKQIIIVNLNMSISTSIPYL